MGDTSSTISIDDYKEEAQALIPLVQANNEQEFVSGTVGLLGTMATGNNILGKLLKAGADRLLATSSYFALQKAVEEDAAAFEAEQRAEATLKVIGDVVEAAIAKVIHDDELYDDFERQEGRAFLKRFGQFEAKYPKLLAGIEQLRSAEGAPLADVSVHLLELTDDATFAKRAAGLGTSGIVFSAHTVRMKGRSVFIDDSGDSGLGK